MTANITDFFNDLINQIAKPIYLTDKTDEVEEEIKHNHWMVVVPSAIIAQTTTLDYIALLEKVKEVYKCQLDKSELDIDLIFYLWLDEPGALCFNFINSNHHRLPFGCKLSYTDRPEQIVEEYLKSQYHDRFIPWEELQTVVTPEEIEEADRAEKDLHSKFILTVYQELIKKAR
jgi:hypothetical protein